MCVCVCEGNKKCVCGGGGGEQYKTSNLAVQNPYIPPCLVVVHEY